MSTPNVYSRSSVCHSSGGRALQNVALLWADGSAGDMADLLAWTQGHLLLLVFGHLNEKETRQLRQLARQTGARCVQVVRKAALATAKEHVVDSHGHLAGCTGHPRWAIVRPDSYLAASSKQLVDAFLTQAVSSATGAAT